MQQPSIFRVLFAGDVVGSPGRKAFAAGVARLREREAVDFVVVNGLSSAIPDALRDPRRVRRICDRHTGVGADGVLLIETSDHADASRRTRF